MDKPQMENGVTHCENASRFRAFVPGTGARPVGMILPRVAWVKLNRLRTGVGQFHSSMHKWGLAPSLNCECGASEQTADHVLTACPTVAAKSMGPLAFFSIFKDYLKVSVKLISFAFYIK